MKKVPKQLLFPVATRLTSVFICLALLPCLLLTGCGALPSPREMRDMALIRTIGIDGTPRQVQITASTSSRARGIKGEREDALVLSAQGTSITGTLKTLQGLSENFVFLGYVDQLLIGEERAQKDIRPILDCFARSAQLSLGAQIWIVRGKAETVASAGSEDGVQSRLETLQQDGEIGESVLSRSAGEAYADLMDLGSAFVPALHCEKDGPVLQAGYAVLRDGRLAGYFEGDAARGLELLMERVPAGVLEETADGAHVTMQVTDIQRKTELTGSHWTIRLKASVNIEEYDLPLSPALLQRLRERAEAKIRSQALSAMIQMQTLDADCAGLGPATRLQAPWLPENLWETELRHTEPEILVNAELQQ